MGATAGDAELHPAPLIAMNVARQRMQGTSVAPRTKWRTAALLVAAGSIAFGALPSGAADYPTRPIRIIVGFAAGGAPDALARIVGEKLAQDWGQPAVVENRTGAQGNTAMAAVAKAAADGYTLALMPVGNAAVNPSLNPNLPYDPVKDFAPITQ